ncbi:MAG: citrate synthase/methylcitrate synthase [Robiginitomaculum sp.]|nr:MAG: citrate synthase/methylcitrate synthase [Robiginitomaculum sp.]
MDAGLEKIIAAETVLSDVDGAGGRLIIRGVPAQQLAASCTFEEVLHLLWSGFFDDLPSREELAQQLGMARVRAFARIGPHIEAIAQQPDMQGLRLGLAFVEDGEALATAIDLLAMAVVVTAAASRFRRGQSLVAPDAELFHAADFIQMSTAQHPSTAAAHAMNAYLVIVAEHGLNASTFAARVVASTRAGLASAVIAGVSALKGPLHGGAPGPVLDMLDGIGSPEQARGWIDDALARKERLMGFGHRVYKVRDPRADALKTAIRTLPTSAGRLQLAEAIEQTILQKLKAEKPDLNLQTNVEFYTAVLLEALGIPRQDFSCVFASARAAGWIAHAKEQLASNRMIRPKSVYVGPAVKPCVLELA